MNLKGYGFAIVNSFYKRVKIFVKIIIDYNLLMS